eukprot:scaffold2489_cov259-Pinguiococcus_pyrenoidosus.AAC.7
MAMQPLVMASTLAPLANSSCTTAWWPRKHAIWRAVPQWLHPASTSALAANSNFTTSTWPS